MRSAISDVPWGNLWRWVVSSILFFYLIGMPLAFLTTLDEGASAGAFGLMVVVVSAVVAAVVVWSDEYPWPGDPSSE